MSLVNVKQCAICEGTTFELFLRGCDYSNSQENFDVVQCQNCKFKFTNPIPSESEIGKYYKADNYISHTSSKKGLFEKVYHIVRRKAIKKKFSLVSRYCNDSILDVGCGTGDFLHYAKQQNWNAAGIEPDADARKLAIEKDLPVKSTDELKDIDENSFNAISMWHVLEHVYNLNDQLATLTKILSSEGYLFIALPNCNSYDAKHYEKYWAAYDLPIHLYHFVPNDIKNLAKNHQLELVETLPMKFDSYYVSMLSEKYKAGKDHLTLGIMIKGFFRGLRSNMKANKESYSSQIYVLKQKKR